MCRSAAMADPKTVAYVKRELRQGYSVEQVKSALAQQGYASGDINEALRAATAKTHTSLHDMKPLLIVIAVLVIVAVVAAIGVVFVMRSTGPVVEEEPALPEPVPAEPAEELPVVIPPPPPLQVVTTEPEPEPEPEPELPVESVDEEIEIEEEISFEPLHTFDGVDRVLALETYKDSLYATTDQGVYRYDGASWSLAEHPLKYVCDLAVYKGKLYTTSFGGENDVGSVYVFDGTSWSLAFDPRPEKERFVSGPCDSPYVFTIRAGISDLADYIDRQEEPGSKLYVGMQVQGLWHSYDGVQWTALPAQAGALSTNFFSNAAYQNEPYIAVGEFYAPDSLPKSVFVVRNKEWTPLDNAPDMQVNSLLAHEGKLYAFGSITAEDVAQGSVYVYDGDNWELLQSFPSALSSGIGPSVVYKNKMIIGTVSYPKGREARAQARLYSS